MKELYTAPEVELLDIRVECGVDGSDEKQWYEVPGSGNFDYGTETEIWD